MKTTNQPFIQLQAVTKTYGLSENQFTALRNVTLDIQSGEFIGIVGKSGSGKSTLMNMISGIDRPSNGTVRIGTQTLSAMTENQMAKWRGRNTGIVFQFFQLIPTLTILENTMLPMDFVKDRPLKDRRDRALSLLELVGIEEQANKFPSTLSGGQQQRAAIARALANNPDLIIADEPTGNLDSKTAESILQLLQRFSKEGKTVIVVSHDQDIKKYCDRVIMIADGNCYEQGGNAHVKLEMV